MALAMILEQAPEFKTRMALRRGAEQFGKRLADYARSFRASYEDTGVHMIDHVVDRFGSGRAKSN